MNLDEIQERAVCYVHGGWSKEGIQHGKGKLNLNVHANDMCSGNNSNNLAMFKLTMVQTCMAAKGSVLSTGA
ncbi:unnamed protein product [Sphenostylis stenocarpa]|uniref:Uncharacterized protein n=1 Tax=Sphenostylis stenocarpa TaxID=92480 RepID=A0AA86T4C7_9FABA|nr:unnamed protein product [Sphenostylis stenocarpa]